jgi:hypothetical protein
MLLKNLYLFALAGTASAGSDLDPGAKTPLVKLKKGVRTVITLVDYMVTAEVSDEDAVAAVPVEQGLENSRSTNKRKQKLRRNGNTMITSKIADRWLRKTINVVKWIQKKYTGQTCSKYGNPIVHDMYEVFSPKFFENYKETPYAKYIEQLVIEEPNRKAVRGMSEARIEKPLTTLYLNYAKVRLWIDENMSLCYDEDKVKNVKESGSKAAGAERIKKWASIAEKKFFRLETRLCTNINKKLLVRTTPDDNPYFDNKDCDSSLFKEKRREKMNEEKKREREQKRREQALKKEAKKNKKKNKNQ